LALAEIDHAIDNHKPISHVLATKGTPEVANNVALRIPNDIDYMKWERSNMKYMMVIKNSIIESIRGAILECQSTTKYLVRFNNNLLVSQRHMLELLLRKLLLKL
jgi:hypothetical protein